MAEFLSANTFFALGITVAAFVLGAFLQKKLKSPLMNPLLFATLVVIGVLLIFKVPVEDYQKGCAPLQYLLTPATICYAVGLYEQIGKLKKNLVAILVGILAGTVASIGGIRLMCMLFGLDTAMTVTLLPKSVTTAIGMVLSEEAGGVAAITTAVIILTGILGNVLGPFFCKWFGIKDDIAKGAAFGTASHAIGTTKAMEISDLCGAVSSMSLTVAGLITVVIFSIFVG